jgi:hypothetical protein
VPNIVLKLPNKKTIVIGVPEGVSVVPLTVDVCELAIAVPAGIQEIPVTIHACGCKCGSWFTPAEPHQRYLNTQHQQDGNNAKRRKTGRVVGR